MHRRTAFAVLVVCVATTLFFLGEKPRREEVLSTAPSAQTGIAADLVFPKNFTFGAAMSAYQTEGGNVNSDWYHWQEKQLGRPLTPEEARQTDHYNRFEEDFELAKQIGLGSVRISIEWARIEPNCYGKFDAREMAHYKEVVRAMTKRGITPFVNLHHFSLPMCYAQRGGWLDPELPGYFARYAAYVVKNLPDVEWWMTFNEPMVVVMEGYVHERYPPGEKSAYENAIRVAVNMLEAHREAYRAIHSVLGARGRKPMVGMASFTPLFLPNSDDVGDVRAATAFNFVKQFFDVGSGKEQDYVGVNYYSRHFLKFNAWSFLFGQHVVSGDGATTDTGTEIYPRGLYEVIMEHRRFGKPIIVTENGLADAKDTRRAKFILEHLSWVHRAIEEGADVRGYFVWSLTDTYEWNSGFGPRFGLVAIDFERDLARSVRPSAFVYGEIAKKRKITPQTWRNVLEKK